MNVSSGLWYMATSTEENDYICDTSKIHIKLNYVPRVIYCKLYAHGTK